MKKIILGLCTLISLSFAGNVKGNLTNEQVVAVQALIQLYGYRCDRVNFAMRSNWSGVIDVSCNDSRYSYDIEDVGGRWTVKVD